MNEAQRLLIEVIQDLLDRVIDISEEEDENFEATFEELRKLINREEEPEAPSSCEKVNKVKLPKNWGKVDGVRF